MGALAFGIALRGLEFISCRSLGLDEARLAINISARSFPRLLAPLDLDQVAPVLFLWAERLGVLTLGHGACPLRLEPVLAGIAGALMMYPLAARFIRPSEARVAALIVLLCPLLVTYSNAAKQYSTEFLFAVLFTWIWDRAVSRDSGRPAVAMLLVGGVLAPWLSLSSPFLLSACLLDLARRGVQDRRNSVRLPVAATLLWGLSCGAAYLLVYGTAQRSPYLQRFWEHAFLVPTRPDFLGDSWRVLQDLVWGFVAGDPLIPKGSLSEAVPFMTAAVLGLALIGLRAVFLTKGRAAVWRLMGPCVALAVTSMAGAFPVAPRLALFTLPALVVLIVAGLQAACCLGESRTSRFAFASLLVIVPLAICDFTRALATEPTEHFRELVRQFRQHRLPQEPVYVFARSLPAWIYYSTDWARPDTARMRRLVKLAGAGGAAFENTPSRSIVQDSDTTGLSLLAADGGELIGLPSGMEWREVVGHVATVPDSGWVAIESRRIEAAASPGVWVLASSFYAPEAQLFSTLERDASRRTFAQLRAGSALVRYEFEAGPSHKER